MKKKDKVPAEYNPQAQQRQAEYALLSRPALAASVALFSTKSH
jgi:hypothetical protein